MDPFTLPLPLCRFKRNDPNHCQCLELWFLQSFALPKFHLRQVNKQDTKFNMSFHPPNSSLQTYACTLVLAYHDRVMACSSGYPRRNGKHEIIAVICL